MLKKNKYSLGKAKFPLLTICLLIFTYATFAWTLANFEGWVLSDIIISIGFSCILAIVLTSPMTGMQNLLIKLFRSDFGALFFVFMLIFLSIILISYMHLFGQALMLFTASLLLRVDLRAYGAQKWQSFWLLLFSSLIGLTLGWLIFYLGEQNDTVKAMLSSLNIIPS